MATNADFDALIVRITTATNTLEADVITLTEGAADIEDSVIAAQTAATNSAASATAAAGSVTAAQAAVTAATTQATNASNSATAANTAKTDTQAIKVETQAIADNLLATAPFQEAPTDGGIYGRQNAGWALVDTGGATPVTAVNGNLPDGTGNVTLAIPDATSDLTNDSGFITAADVPAAPVQEAPVDGKQYARKDAAWEEVVSSGGGGAWPSTFEEVGNTISLDGGTTFVPWTQWQYANPFRSQPFNVLKRTAAPIVDQLTGYNAWFTNVTNISSLPAGKYYFGSQDFKNAVGGAAIFGQSGVITVEHYGDSLLSKRAWAVTFNTSGTVGGMYMWRPAGTWFPIGTQTA